MHDPAAATASVDAAAEKTLHVGASVGTLVALTPDCQPIVAVHQSFGGVSARTCVSLDDDDIGRDVVLLFEAGDPHRAIVMGVLRGTGDRERITLRADESITLRCGGASVTLMQDGKVVIRGTHVISHAVGVNRIRGGSVELN